MSPTDPGTQRVWPWLVCPSSDRWLRATRYFAREMIPEEVTVAVRAAAPADTHQQLRGPHRALVFWDVAAENLGSWCNWITKTAIHTPDVLQLAAVTELSAAEQAILAELGIVAMIRHPEQLPTLGGITRKYFAPAGGP